MQNVFIISVLILLPNLIIIFLPPGEAQANPRLSITQKVMTGFERIGQGIVFISPLFYSIYLNSTIKLVGFFVMIIAISFYYAGWARYLLHGKKYKYLFMPMLGIPIPLAVSPVTYFFASSIVLNSWVLLVGTVIFAIGHLYVSYNSYLEIK